MTAIASATLSGVSPPARISGTCASARVAASSQSKLSPVPPGVPGAVRVEQVEVGAKGLRRLDVGAAAHPQRLDHLAAGAPRHLAAEVRALVAVQLQDRQRLVLGRPGDLVEGRVDEHADDLDLAPQLGADRHRGRRVAAARAAARSG